VVVFDKMSRIVVRSARRVYCTDTTARSVRVFGRLVGGRFVAFRVRSGAVSAAVKQLFSASTMGLSVGGLSVLRRRVLCAVNLD